MLHYSCDICKRPIKNGLDVRHVVKIEVFPAVDDDGSGGQDEAAEGDADHLDDMHELLERLDDDDLAELDGVTRSMRFDLCDACRQRFLRNPLGVKSGKNLDFSNN